MILDVPLIPQTSNMSCWAASIAMILGWRDSASYDQRAIAANFGGPSYMPSFQNGLDPNDHYILKRNGFRLDAPICYSLAAVSDRLHGNGPLWVAGFVPLPPSGARSPHIRVVRGLEGGTVHVNDPWPADQGARYTRSFDRFLGRMETLGSREMNQPNPVYVAYLT